MRSTSHLALFVVLSLLGACVVDDPAPAEDHPEALGTTNVALRQVDLAVVEMEAVRDEVIRRLIHNGVEPEEALEAVEDKDERRLLGMLGMGRTEAQRLYDRLQRANRFRNEGPSWEPPPWAERDVNLSRFECGRGYGTCIFTTFSGAGIGTRLVSPAVAIVAFGLSAYGCICEYCRGAFLEWTCP